MANIKKTTKTKKPTKQVKITKITKVTKKATKEPMTVKKTLFAIFVIILPLVVGSIASVFTINAQGAFQKFNQPPLAPPAWLFPVVWTVLYLMMGLASYLIFRVKPQNKMEERLKVTEIVLFYVQLALNFGWTLIFFNADAKYFAFGWLVVMWLVIFALIAMAFKNRKAAAWILLPYLLWCTFAAYLNISIAMLN